MSWGIETYDASGIRQLSMDKSQARVFDVLTVTFPANSGQTGPSQWPGTKIHMYYPGILADGSWAVFAEGSIGTGYCVISATPNYIWLINPRRTGSSLKKIFICRI